MRARRVAVVALLVVVAGCSVLQEERRCPGADCSEELARVVDDVAGLPGVTHVDQAAWSSGLDNGVAGRVDVVAAGLSRDEARTLAAEIIAVYRDSGTDEPAIISVEVASDPRMQFGSAGRYSFWAGNGEWDRIREH